MSSKIIVSPEQYENVLCELSDNENEFSQNNASDIDEREVIEHSDHDMHSEINGDFNQAPQDSSENDDTDSDNDDYFTKTICKRKNVRGKIVKEVSEVHKWRKTSVKSKFARTPNKNIMKKILSHTKNCIDVKDEFSAFQKIINSGTTDAIVKYTNMYILRTKKTNYPKILSKQYANETNRAEVTAFVDILYLLGTEKNVKLHTSESWARDDTGIEILQDIMG